MTLRFVLSIDQGTTSTRAVLMEASGKVVATQSMELTQYYPQNGWVEHDADEILSGAAECVRRIIDTVDARQIAGIGITNQRETTVIWNRRTGQALYRAIVWQDRRTSELCERLRQAGHAEAIQEKTGLLLDPYFSGTKLAWLLEHVPGASAMAQAGELAFGTIDSWLIHGLTDGRSHVTDATNASRTMLFNIREQCWDEEILRWLHIPRSVLPRVQDCTAQFGTTSRALIGAELPILGVAGDQQAAAIGQACFKSGMVKSTYGTGCFMLLNTGSDVPHSEHRLLGTVAYRFGGKSTYALEGSIFMAGATIEWLVDAGIIAAASDVGPLAATANPDSRCYLVPGFTGLGAPYWSTDARGALLGMTRDTGAAEICAAALDAAAHQTRDLLEAMVADTGVRIEMLRVDGGMARSTEFLQRLADLTGTRVVRAANTETTAIGAAYLAGLQAGVFSDLEAIEALWCEEASFAPNMSPAERDVRYEGWRQAVRRVL